MAMEPEVLDKETGQIQAGGAMALVQMGHELVRIENETMQKVAVQRPRKPKDVLDEALAELELVPELASLAYYSLPMKDRSGEEEVTKFIEGPSINAAMSLARLWGNCNVGSRVLKENEDGVEMEGFFLDMESNFRVTRPFSVSKFFKKRTGQIIRLLPDRWQMAQGAGASKAMRNAILAGLPKSFVIAYTNKAKELVGGKQDEPADPKVVKAALQKFQTVKVTRDMLEHKLDKPIQDWLGSDVSTLRGLWTALEDKQTTVEEVFGVAQEEAKDSPQPSAPLSNVQAAQEDDVKREIPNPNQAGLPLETKATHQTPPPPPPQAPPTTSGPKRIPQKELWDLLCVKFGGQAGAVHKLKELTGGKKSNVTALKDHEAEDLIKRVVEM